VCRILRHGEGRFGGPACENGGGGPVLLVREGADLRRRFAMRRISEKGQSGCEGRECSHLKDHAQIAGVNVQPRYRTERRGPAGHRILHANDSGMYCNHAQVPYNPISMQFREKHLLHLPLVKHFLYSPFPLFFMNASSPPRLSSFSFAASLVLSLVFGLEMVA